jgi:TolA-binding protein
MASGCGCGDKFKKSWAQFVHKVEELAKADLENTALRHQNHMLHAENNRLKYQLLGKKEKQHAHHVHAAAVAEGGERSARIERSLVPEASKQVATNHQVSGSRPVSRTVASAVPASIVTAAPAASGHETHVRGHGDLGSAHSSNGDQDAPSDNSHAEHDLSLFSVPPKKVYEESLRSFAGREYDRAARGFIALASNPDNTAYATAEVHLLAAVSLFHLNNFGGCLNHLGEAERLAQSTKASSSEYLPKILLWKAMALKKQGKVSESRSVAQHLIEKFPGTPEAKKVR